MKRLLAILCLAMTPVFAVAGDIPKILSITNMQAVGPRTIITRHNTGELIVYHLCGIRTDPKDTFLGDAAWLFLQTYLEDHAYPDGYVKSSVVFDPIGYGTPCDFMEDTIGQTAPDGGYIARLTIDGVDIAKMMVEKGVAKPTVPEYGSL